MRWDQGFHDPLLASQSQECTGAARNCYVLLVLRGSNRRQRRAGGRAPPPSPLNMIVPTGVPSACKIS